MQARCCPLIILIISLLVCSTADEKLSHKLVKRQSPPQSGAERAFPLSRSRQFPPPEELEESEYELSEDEDPGLPVSSFRGRQPPSSDDYESDEQTVTEAPKITTPTPQKSTPRTNIFNNNRLNARPKFGVQFSTKPNSTTPAPKPSTASNSNPRFRATPAQSQRLDVVANILNKPPPQRSSARAIAPSRTANENSNQKPTPKSSVPSDQVSRRSESSGGTRVRMRARPRTRSTTTTTTTTTTQAAPEEYYYYYEDDDEAAKNQPIATTTSTTTTTTTPRPSLPKRPSLSNRRPTSSRSTPRPVVKFDLESQFVPPPEEPLDVIKPTTKRPTSNRNSKPTSRSAIKFDLESQFQPPPEDIVEDIKPATAATKRFTTSTTTEPPGGFGDIPIHLRNRYKPRTDGRFIDFLRDPNRPRELKGFDLTDYPFYIRVPEDIVFDCDDKKDGYYASVPHHCQLFHYCFAGARYDFLCANYTLYDQTTFTCRFANNVDCLASEKFYYRNDDLWKETTTVKPETTTKFKRRPRPRDYDDDEYDYEEYDDEEEEGRRRRPPRRRRNRRKNRRRQQDDSEEESKTK